MGQPHVVEVVIRDFGHGNVPCFDIGFAQPADSTIATNFVGGIMLPKCYFLRSMYLGGLVHHKLNIAK
jgi:hypothetical protein